MTVSAEVGPTVETSPISSYKIEPLEGLKPLKVKLVARKLVEPPKPVVPISLRYNNYAPLNCTFGVASWTSVPGDWGNANQWDDNAIRDGYTVSPEPVAGSVAQTDRGTYGHVALVLSVHGNTITIKEQNYDYNGSIRTIDVPRSSYVYIYV